MFRYADPRACPACRTAIPAGAPRCATCGTQLSGEVAQDLFRTLVDADGLVAELLRLSATPTAARTEAPVLAHAGSPRHEAIRPSSRAGMLAVSGPRILLGLGALCLVVAAIVFLAVAWSSLGVAGRTAVLLALTAGAGAAAAWLARKALPGGAEAFTSVALALLVVDLAGAESAGWFGGLSDASVLLLCGSMVAVVGLGAAIAARRTPIGRLHSAQVVAGPAFGFATLGLVELLEVEVAPLLALLLVLGLVVLVHRVGLVTAAVALLPGAALWWLYLATMGATQVDDSPTFVELWSDLAAWPLLACTATLALGSLVRPLPVVVRVGAAAGAVGLGTLVLTLPAVDESLATVTIVAAVVAASAVPTVRILRGAWRWVGILPVGAAAAVLAGVAMTRGAQGLVAHLDHEVWAHGAFDPLGGAALGWDGPLLLPLAVLGLLAAGFVVAELVLGRVPMHWWEPAALALVAALVLLPGMYAGPAALALGVLSLVVAGTAAVALAPRVPTAAHSDSVTAPLAGVVAGWAAGLGLLLASTSDVLTAVATGLLTGAAVALSGHRDRSVQVLGDIGFAPAAAGFAWTVLHLLDVDASWRAVPILVLLGGWAILSARTGREVPAALVGTVVVPASLVAGSLTVATWLAVDLTVAAALVGVSALLHPDRRRLGWASLALFTLAQWVRLGQVGVDTVEAYTLPLALVLLTVGTVSMARRGIGSFRALSSGLGLALVPSLLASFAEPVSLRALLLGTACAAVVLVGARLRWAAPIVLGGAAGAALVLRELAHSGLLHQWVVIGLIGLVLIVVGTTWERRLAEVRDVAARLQRLR